MNNTTIRMWPVMAVLLAALPAAVPAQEGAANYDAAEAQLRAIAPDATTITLSDSPIEGLLQAQVNNDIVYISKDGTYLMQGTLFDIDSRTNLTDQAKSVLRREKIRDLDDAQQIVFAPEDPEFELLVFTDIDCGYCRKLHNQIDEYVAQGIAIHYLAFPRAGIGSHSFDKYVSVWCADDQQEALTMAKAGTDPEPQQCDNPITSQYELGREIGVSGTPALLTSDGTLIPGYMPPETLKARLEAIKADLAAASP